MSNQINYIKEQLYSCTNPYDNIDEIAQEKGILEDVRGFGDAHPVFVDLINISNPGLIIEVGSWLGTSALSMCRHLKNIKSSAKIICVDTWLMSPEHMTPGNVGNDDYQMYQRNGYPENFYYQFLYNMRANKCDDIVLPIRNTSVNVAKWLIEHNIKADLIYLDASHEYEEVKNDINLYMQILSDDGILFGDDFCGFEGVRQAVNECVKDYKMITKAFWVTSKNKEILSRVPEMKYLW